MPCHTKLGRSHPFHTGILLPSSKHIETRCRRKEKAFKKKERESSLPRSSKRHTAHRFITTSQPVHRTQSRNSKEVDISTPRSLSHPSTARHANGNPLSLKDSIQALISTTTSVGRMKCSCNFKMAWIPRLYKIWAVDTPITNVRLSSTQLVPCANLNIVRHKIPHGDMKSPLA